MMVLKCGNVGEAITLCLVIFFSLLLPDRTKYLEGCPGEEYVCKSGPALVQKGFHVSVAPLAMKQRTYHDLTEEKKLYISW